MSELIAPISRSSDELHIGCAAREFVIIQTFQFQFQCLPHLCSPHLTNVLECFPAQLKFKPSSYQVRRHNDTYHKAQLHGIAARVKLQSQNLFVRTTFSDTTEGLIVQCQSNLATPSEQRADRTERIAMACIPGTIDGVGGTEELHGIAARAKLQS